MNRPLLSITLAVILLWSLFMPAPLLAQDEQASTGKADKQLITLEQAIQITKKNFEIPAELIDFSSGFNDYNSRQAWSLNWSSTGTQAGSLSAQVDAVSGEILSIYYSKPYNPDQYYKTPAVSLQQAEKTADQYLKKLTGDKYQRLKLIEDKSIIPINTYGQTYYGFTWQRIENDIPVPDNGASIQIDAETGQLTSYYLNWTDLNFAPAKTIDSTEATQAFSKANLLELQYFLAPEIRPLKTADGNQEQVQLVYQLKNDGTIDALTGKPVILNQDQYWAANDAKLRGGMGAAQLDTEQAALTPQEQQEIVENLQLLTKEQAIAAIKKWVEIPKDFSIKNINLYKDSSLRGDRVWSFSWENQKGTQYIHAKVNARNGELISFSSYNSSSVISPETKPISQDQAKKIAEDFIRKIQPEKFKQTKLKADDLISADNSSGDLSAKLSLPVDTNSVTFYYQRIVNNILFPANQILVTVDLYTKKITSYQLDWWNLNFPQLSEAMGKNKAEELFFQSRPMKLQYAIVYDRGEPKEARLVYRPSADSSAVSDMMDAKNGNFLDWRGKPLTGQPQRLIFNDIGSDPNAKEITALGMAGLFGEYGNQFKPQDNLTVIPLLKALLAIKNGIPDSSLSPEDIIKEAKKLGWVQEDISTTQVVTRELFSKIIIRCLGLEQIARINHIYTSPFSDAQTFAPAAKGYISLVTGLEIISPSQDGKFQPGRPMTRSEAAYSIIKALEFGFRY